MIRFTRGQRVVHIADVRETDAFRNKPIARKRLELRNIRTWLAVALCRDGTLLGVINVHRHEVRPFTDKQIALLENFADQAVIAIENARLLNESARTHRRSRRIARIPDRDQRCAQGHQPLDLRSAAGARYIADDRGAAVQGRNGADLRCARAAFIRSHRASRFPPNSNEIARRLRFEPDRGSVTGRAALERRVVHVADIAADPEYALPEVITIGKMRTALGVPLLRESEPIGVLYLARQRVEPFTERQIELVRTFADQAVIAMENARLLGELQARTRDLEELLEYQTATSDVLKVISRSTFDLQPILDTVAETAARLCDAGYSAIFRREGEVYRIATVCAFSPDTMEAARKLQAFLRDHPLVPGRGSITGRVVLEGTVIQVADTASDPEYTLSQATSLGNLRTQLGVPLLRKGEPIGVIVVARQRVEPFTERQIELVRTFADQAVIAIENARLLGELQARTDELTRSVAELQALEEVLRAVNSSLDLDTVLATIISRAAQLSQADEGTIYEFDETEQVFVPKSAFGMSAERVEGLRERQGQAGRDPSRPRRGRARAGACRGRAAGSDEPRCRCIAGGIHAVLAVPLLREDKVVGGLVIRRRTVGGFAPTIPTLLQTFAGQAVLAIENARLFQELAARGEEARRAHAAAENALADLRRAQDRLIQAEKMASFGQLTAGIAHEIKNPLNFVNNFAGLSVELLDELKETAAPALAALDGDKLADVDEIVAMLTGNLEKIAEHGRRADGIVKSMLEHSRGGTGERREVDLNALVEEALNLAYHGARAQDPELQYHAGTRFRPGHRARSSWCRRISPGCCST